MADDKLTIKEKIISLLAEDEVNRQYFIEQIEKIAAPQLTDFFYSSLIDLFVHLSVDEDEAKRHWGEIFVHYDQICTTLGRDVGLRLAIFDYFINVNKYLESPLLVEIRMFKEAEQYAMFDPLTGLFNRRYFDISLTKELRRAKRYEKNFSIFLLDIDNFKNINDTYGHVIGDEVLKRFAAFLKLMSREEDIICRFGGEEFIIVLPETSARGTLSYYDRIRSAMKKDAFFTQYKITFSGGISQYSQGGKTAQQLIANADKSLYDAKLAGKDQVMVSKVEKRKLFRYPKTWQVYLQPLGHQKKGANLTACVTLNISLNGLLVEVAEDHAKGDKILLNIELPDKEKIVVVGEIIWAGNNKGAPSKYGIKYIDLSPEQLKQMEILLDRDLN